MSIKAERAYQDALKVLSILEESGFQAKLAGGCVRDRCMGLTPRDYDIATDALPDQVCTLFKQKNLKVVPTGIDHGTVTVVMKTGPVEVTTLRRDLETDGRHAVVAFGSSFEEDAARRDFTINAMFEDAAGRIEDFHGGRQHIADRQLIFVGDPLTRIREDYLRILRYFRFMARFGFSGAGEGAGAIRAGASGLDGVSQERITSEILQLLGSPAPLAALELMEDTGVLPVIAGTARLTENARRLAGPLPLKDQGAALCRLAALAPPDTDPEGARQLAAGLRLSNQESRLLGLLLLRPEQTTAPGPAAADYMGRFDDWEKAGGKGVIADLLLPAWHCLYPEAGPALNQLEKTLISTGPLRTRPLPVSGRDLKKAGLVGEGPEMGRLLARLKEEFRNGRFSSREEAMARARLLAETSKNPEESG